MSSDQAAPPHLLTGDAVILGLRLAGDPPAARSFREVGGVCGGVEKPCAESRRDDGGVRGGVRAGLDAEDDPPGAVRLWRGSSGEHGGDSL